jgi:N-acetylmuramoyl-L-alanine amidase
MQISKKTSLVLFVSLIVSFFAWFLPVWVRDAAAADQVAVIGVDVLNVRNGPGTNHGIVSRVGLNERLPVLDQSGDWYQVRLGTGESGWVAGWLLDIETVTAAADQVAVIGVDVLNVRSGPGTHHGIVSRVGLNERLPVLDQSGDWYQVRLGTGESGWVAGWLLDIETVPAVQPPAPAEPVPPQESGGTPVRRMALINSEVVNVRSGPGINNEIISQVGLNEDLPVLNQNGDWYRVQLSTGEVGWVAGSLVSIRTVPVAPPDPPSEPGETESSRGNGGRDGDQSSDGVLSLEVDELRDKTRFVIKAGTSFAYSSFTLNAPKRLVIDMEGVSIGNLASSTEVGSNSVSQIRAGYFQREPDITRLVLDLKDGVQYTAAQSDNRKTLTIETYVPQIKGSYKNKVIAIDPGHGGSEPGTIGSLGTKEKDVNLDVAKKVAGLLEAQGAKVLMTRTGDWNVGLYERNNEANRKKADIFVSIHFNAHLDRSKRGTSTYIYSNYEKPSEAARTRESNKLAQCVQSELLKELGLNDIGIRDANFVVLRNADMPAILVEVAYLSNQAEERLIITDSFKNRAAEAIVKGIGLYLSQN